MAFNFPVLTDDQINESRGILKPGIYRFQCINAKEAISKNGNSMIVLDIKAFDENGKPHQITDYLVSTEKMSYKIKHFFNSIGNPEKYNYGNATTIDFLNKTGFIKTGIEISPDGFQKAKIIDYIVKSDPKIIQTQEKQYLNNPVLEESNFDINDVPF